MKNATWPTLIVFSAAVLAPGCGEAALSGPPNLRPGRDECAECGMLISEERCAAALLVEMPPGGGRRRHLVFDDIGCLLDAELHRAAEFSVVERYLHDFERPEWVRAERAACVTSMPDHVHTPMGSGMVAFVDASRAGVAAVKSQGTVTDYNGLMSIRREWWEARRRGSSPGR